MGKKSEEQPSEIVSYTDSKYLIDLTKNPTDSQLRFAVLNGKGPELLSWVKPREGLWFRPVTDRFGMCREVISLPSEPKKYGTQQDLVEKMQAFVHRYLDCSEHWEPLIVHYCLMTWVYDCFSSVPYLRFLNDYGAGKTRALTIAHGLSYKGMMTVGATTASPVFRLIEQYAGTLILDEADWNSSDMKTDMVQILNCGYQHRGTVLRSTKVGQDFEPRPFKVYCPKVIANRNRFDDQALESRCLTIQDTERDLRDDIPRQLSGAFEQEALELRNQLLQWRFDNFRVVKIDEEPLKRLSPRVCETASTLYSVSKDTRFQEWLVDFLTTQGEIDKEDLPRTKLARVILELYRPGKEIPYSEITEAYNEQSEPGEHLTGKKSGVYIRSLGLVYIGRRKYGCWVKPTTEDITRLKRKYGYLG